MEIKPNHKAIKAYFKAMDVYRQQGVMHEMAVRQGFASLLEEVASTKQWSLIMEYTLPNGKRIDGAVLDSFRIPWGYWETKDSGDDLETEIKKNIALGYPLSNTIFEDTRNGVLYQNGQRIIKADLSERTDIAELLNLFLSHTQPQVEEFHHAVLTFQERIPELAKALLEHINQEDPKKNNQFVATFEHFYTLCKQTLNPNLSRDAVKEMLVQHLLTERLFRTIFNNPDFTDRNVIAAEIEKVIKALTRRAFSRQDFLNQLDYFYGTIEQAAATITDFGEKQGFLNTVYERFFQGFSQKQADTHGIVYTPQEVVDFMCSSVDAVLQHEFGLSLSSKDVSILDPCVGTGNFMVHIIRRLSRMTLCHKYEHELFCNEVMLLPYYIASLNIEHAYYEITGEYAPFDGICFADTIDMVESQQADFLTEKNTERIEKQKEANIMVIIGNPPYNMGQLNENDNNKNRTYETVDGRIRETYAKDSKATLNTKLYDMYVRFFRWATDRLEGRDGIICFVSNNSFVDQIAFDGMRKHLQQDFTHIYHLDLHGNVRQNPKLSGTKHNIFGIQVGVGITLLVRKSGHDERLLSYHRVPEDWCKEQKLTFLADTKDVHHVVWETLHPDARYTWLTHGLHAEFETFLPLGTKEAKAEQNNHVQTMFKTFSHGVNTSRDSIAYNFDNEALAEHIEAFIEEYNAEVSRWIRTGKPTDIDTFLRYDKVKWSRNLKRDLQHERFATYDLKNIRSSIYRPFAKKWLYHADIVVDERGQVGRSFFPTLHEEIENSVISVSSIGSSKLFHCIIANSIVDFHLTGDTQCFPFYTYDEDGSNRQENITDWALEQFQEYYDTSVTKWDIFYYTYAMLHHPKYRERYAENIRRELPRIPTIGNSDTFQTLVNIGTRLAELHLHYEQADEYPLKTIENHDVAWTWRVEKMKLTRDKTTIVVNDALTLSGIPSACFNYRLGNRSALEWVIDQYQVKTDRRSGIVSDPNRDDDPEYIVRLIGRIITVSIETVKLVEHLAAMPLNGSTTSSTTSNIHC